MSAYHISRDISDSDTLFIFDLRNCYFHSSRSASIFFHCLLKYLRLYGINKTVQLIWCDDSYPARKLSLCPTYKSNRFANVEGAVFDDPNYEDFVKAVMLLPSMYAKCEGEEADDVIATIVKSFGGKKGVYIVSTDSDLEQLVSDNVVLVNGEAVNHAQYIKTVFLKAVLGDYTDNIKGFARKFGKANLTNLVYNSHSNSIDSFIKEIKSNPEFVELAKLEDAIRLNYRLVKLDDTLNPSITISKGDRKNFEGTPVIDIFNNFAFTPNSLGKMKKLKGD